MNRNSASANQQSTRPAVTESDALSIAFAHLAVLRRKLTPEQMRERAIIEMWNLARLATNGMDLPDLEQLRAEMVDMFMRRLWKGSLLVNFKGTGSIEAYLYTAMKFIARECLRARVRRRIETRDDQSTVPWRGPSPSIIAEQSEYLDLIRVWAKGLTVAQRNALAWRCPRLRDLGNGERISNVRVNLHRAIKKLRQKALELDDDSRVE